MWKDKVDYRLYQVHYVFFCISCDKETFLGKRK